jgi:hypothetical protein
LTANREFNLSTAILTYFFGDELKKKVEELSPISLATMLPPSLIRITVQNLTGCPLAEVHMDGVVLIRLAVKVVEQGRTPLF